MIYKLSTAPLIGKANVILAHNMLTALGQVKLSLLTQCANSIKLTQLGARS